MATGTTKAVRELLAANPKMTAAAAVEALQGHNPATVRTQIARQRNAAQSIAPVADVTTLNVHKVWLDANVSMSNDATRAMPTAPYVYIVLRAGHDARFIEGEGKRAAIEKLRNIRSTAGITDKADRDWIAQKGGVLALIFTAA